MIKKPVKKDYSSFSFMNPLSEEIWLLVVFSYSLVSVVMYIVSRYSPSEVRLLSGQLYTDLSMPLATNGLAGHVCHDDHSVLGLPPPPPPPSTISTLRDYSTNTLGSPEQTASTVNSNNCTPNAYCTENEPEQLMCVNDFNLINSAWFALGAIMQQGVDVCPR